MVEHAYRVMARGRFTDLDDAGRGRLPAEVERHGVLTDGFTDRGALSCDRSLDFFSVRVQLRSEVETTDRAVCDHALAPASRAIEEFGVDLRDMRASATDVDPVKIRRPR